MTDVGLQGRLSDFTLEEILQLIALQQDGLLTVDASYPMILAFESGLLVGYRDRRRSGVDPLANFLKRYGFFPAESWEHIDFVSRHSNLDLTEILVNEGLTSADELAHLQQEAAQEDVFRGMQLRDGRYHFLPGRDGLASLKGRIRLKVDGLLMEAVRRIDEITSLRENFYSDDLKIRRSDLDVDPSERSPNQRRLLAAIGISSTLGNVIAQGRMAEFEALHTLQDLLNDGVITVLSPPRARTEDAAPTIDMTARRRKRSTRSATVFGAVCLLVALGIAALQPWSFYQNLGGTEPTRGEVWADARMRAEMEAALQLFREQHQRFPASLEELVADGWVSRRKLDRFQKKHTYRRLPADEYALEAGDPPALGR